MTHIMKKCRQSNHPAAAPQAIVIEMKLASQAISIALRDTVEQHRRHVHNAERMLEPGVHGAGVNVIRPGELTDPAEALKRQLIDNIPLPAIERDKTVNRAPDLIDAVSHGV
jgi:hypothetical protein